MSTELSQGPQMATIRARGDSGYVLTSTLFLGLTIFRVQ